MNGMAIEEIVVYSLYGGGFLLCFSCILSVVYAQYRVLRHIHPRNRTINPPMVWLNLIPCFNLVYGFISVLKVAESLDREFYDLRVEKRGDDYGKGLGIAGMCIWVVGIFICGLFAVVPVLVLGFLYAASIRGYTQRLVKLGGDEIAEAEDEPEQY